jgi:integrating conjugative element membrane protein (TIGR03747 family)
MAESRPGAATIKRPGPGGRLLIGLLGFTFWLVLGLIGNILFEWVCIGYFWPEEGPKRSQAMLEEELRYLREDFTESLLVDQPVAFAVRLAGQLHGSLYQKTGIEAWVNRAEVNKPPAQESLFQQQRSNFVQGAKRYLHAAMIATQVYAVRVAVLILALPIFGLLGLVGLVDGMVQRDLRRWGGGREHGQIYHLAKRGIGPSLALPWIIYLAWPTTVHPNAVIVPFAVLFAFILMVSAATFKKYL